MYIAIPAVTNAIIFIAKSINLSRKEGRKIAIGINKIKARINT